MRVCACMCVCMRVHVCVCTACLYCGLQNAFKQDFTRPVCLAWVLTMVPKLPSSHLSDVFALSDPASRVGCKMPEKVKFA